MTGDFAQYLSGHDGKRRSVRAGARPFSQAGKVSHFYNPATGVAFDNLRTFPGPRS